MVRHEVGREIVRVELGAPHLFRLHARAPVVLRRAREAMRPAGDAAVGAERRRQLVMAERPEEVVLQVVRPGPHELDRPAGRLRDEGRLGHEVVGEAPAESAARPSHLDADRGARDAGHRVHGARCAAGLLQGRDDARAVGLHVHECARRLERRMAHERDAVARLDDLRGGAGRGIEVAVVAHDLAGLRQQLRALRVERGARFGRERATRPLDFQGIPALERGPHVVGDDRDAGREVGGDRLAGLGARHDDHGTYARHGACRGVVEPRDVAVEVGAAQHDGRARLRLVDVDAVARAARDDLFRVDDAARLADDPILGGRLERHRPRWAAQASRPPRRARHTPACGRPGAARGRLPSSRRRTECPTPRPRPGASASGLARRTVAAPPSRPECSCCRPRPARPSASAARRR